MDKPVKGFWRSIRARAMFVIAAGLGLFALIHLFGRVAHDEFSHIEEAPQIDVAAISWRQDIQPLLNRRCVICHSCYDAPCQLKLSSPEGIERGANEEKVYQPKRLRAMAPTRLFIDADSTEAWRDKGFHSVTERVGDGKSLMHRLLDLKKQHPQPAGGKLPDDFTLDINRDQLCVKNGEFEEYAAEHPLWGMPYAMPNLHDHEWRLLTRWLQQGAPMDDATVPVAQAGQQISQWERFLNGASNKQRLVSRYLYEHLFHAHIHFEGTPLNEFYRLVRSATPPGQAIDEIATLRPYDDPGVASVYYRFRRYTPVVVAKNHIVYRLSSQRLQRYRELFIEPRYEVGELPSYQPEMAANPFKVFAAIPPDSRYRFLLDEARFFIEGFIKGPVCRGQIALNVIEDQFWVLFFDPDQKVFTTQASFLDSMSDYLRIPSERGSHLNLLPIWTDYWKRQKQYMLTKQAYFQRMSTHTLEHAMRYIWDGEGSNPNAALTVFRHFDSASVEYGLVGEPPETAWVVDYPLFERIHYLLVAGFNVYGNVVHQLSTRIFMDFLRMEGEDHFLAFLPSSRRKAIRDSWYQGIREELDTLFDAPMDWLNADTVTGYQREDVQQELYGHIRRRTQSVLQHGDMLNLCGGTVCTRLAGEAVRQRVDRAMQKVATMRGMQLHDFPDVSFVRVNLDDNGHALVYSIVRNKAYKNVVSLLSDEREREMSDIERDTVTVVDWLVGSYPNFFFSVDLEDIEDFAAHCAAIDSEQSFESFVVEYGVRRTDPRFWDMADWFQQQYAIQRPLFSGLYDLSRYSNL